MNGGFKAFLAICLATGAIATYFREKLTLLLAQLGVIA
jgi:hypothetical protein